MAERVVEIRKVDSGGWRWAVYCDGEFLAGSIEETRKDAKRAAKQVVCNAISGNGGGSNIIITPNGGTYVGENGEVYTVEIEPPAINASINNGHFEYSEMKNPWTDEFQHFNVEDISENELAWIAGLCFYNESFSQNYQLVAAMLKVWDVYLGGNSMEEIKTLHNLSDEYIDSILTKSWSKIIIHKIENENETVHLDWVFEY